MSEEQERTKEKKKIFLDEFEKSYGIILTACTKAGINRSTYYRWCDSDEEFKKKANDIERIQVGFVHDKLMAAIVNDNITGVIFYLKNKHPDYKQKLELSGEVTTKEKYQGLTDEEILKRIEETRIIEAGLVKNAESDSTTGDTEGS